MVCVSCPCMVGSHVVCWCEFGVGHVAGLDELGVSHMAGLSELGVAGLRGLGVGHMAADLSGLGVGHVACLRELRVCHVPVVQ